MKSVSKVFIAAVVILSVALASDALSNQEKARLLTHVVVCWLDNSVKKNEVDVVINEAKKLASIPGVLNFSIGKAIESERNIVDDSFTFAVSMNFKNVKEMKQYLKNATHIDFVEKILKPKVAKIIVYDF